MPSLNHHCEITPGIRMQECAELLQSFFQARRRADIPDA
jgi:tRNA(Arg) A34 adenosine deaminase TadA